MKKTLLVVCLLAFATNLCHAQDSTATINKSWPGYATDTGLTFRQIIKTCDSQFAAAGYTDTMHSEEDGTPFVQYRRWKNFWSTRCDVATGKLHNFAAAAIAALSAGSPGGSHGGYHGAYSPTGSSSITNCEGGSPLQSNTAIIPSTAPGWTWIGPQNISDQHIGRVDGIVVNPAHNNEIYVTDTWGGIWKTINGGTTWTCLSDNMPYLSGIGITDLYVDFTSSPRRLFCLADVPGQSYAFFPLEYPTPENTVGIFYSLDDGNTFSSMISTIPGILNDPILDVVYWPGNTPGGAQYLFVSTQFQIYRVDITHIATTAITAADWTTMVDMSTIVPTDAQTARFRGFSGISFLPANPTIMYVATNSNYGNGYQETAGLYRMTNCKYCAPCTLTGIPLTSTTNPPIDILYGYGNFSLGNFSQGWWSSVIPCIAPCTPLPDWGWPGGPNIQCIPELPVSLGGSTGSRAKSVETAVDGSYLGSITYNVSFTLSLPPYTEVDVVMKDVNSTDIFSADWGSLTTPNAGDIGCPANCPDYFPVGPGANSGGIQGKYKNNTSGTISIPITGASVTATHFVDRLEFATWATSTSYHFTGTNYVQLSGVQVLQPFENYVYNLTTTPANPNYLYCATNNSNNSTNPEVQIINDNGTTASVINNFYMPTVPPATTTFFQISPTNPDYLYLYSNQTSGDPMLWRMDIINPTIIPTPAPPDANAQSFLHADARSMAVMKTITGTDHIYIGDDGGIGEGTFSITAVPGLWTNLNGTGMKTYWGFDIGSDNYTGEVSIAGTDNGIMVSNYTNFNNWVYNPIGDGGQSKYGKRYATSNVWFQGSSSASGFDWLSSGYPNGYSGGAPFVSSFPDMSIYGDVYAPPLGKLVTTYNNEYVGQGVQYNTSNPSNDNIYDVTYTGSGASLSPYNMQFTPITTDPTYSVHEPVQAIAPDMYDPSYVAAYVHHWNYDQGYFVHTLNATAAVPTWSVVPNSTGQSLISLVADPRSPNTSKRLWAGAGGYYSAASALGVPVPGIDRVFESDDGGGTWTDISAGLQDGPVNVLLYDELSQYLFAGTDQGIYAFNAALPYSPSSNYWQCYSLNLPNTYITGLDINRCTGKIYASTYGRGAFEADLPPINLPPGLNQTGGMVYITTNTTWGENIDIRSNIYIPAGVTLTIQNCTVTMGKDNIIAVAPGGRLVVTNATITNACGTMWWGICALGPGFGNVQTTANSGWVVIENGSLIENAQNAVCNGNTWIGPSAPGWLGGGVIQANGSEFLNNQTAVNFGWYTSGSPYLSSTAPDLSSFVNCTFSIDHNYITNTLYPFQHHVYLYEVLGIPFNGCLFRNRNTLPGYGDGITSIDASFSVGPYCPTGYIGSPSTCSGTTTLSRFCGFTNGIDIQNVIGANPTIVVQQAIFDSNTVGVYGSAFNNISVTQCNFKVGNGGGVREVRSEEFTGCNQNIGILFQNIQQFQMEGNTFTGIPHPGDWYNFGTVVANSCYADSAGGVVSLGTSSVFTNYVNNNWFNTLTNGVYALGCNRGYLLTGSIGLEITCNAFSNNINDIYVANDGNNYGMYHPQGIAQNQLGGYFGTYYPIATGNTFNGGSTYNIVNHSGSGITYYYGTAADQDPTLLDPGSTTAVSRYATTFSNGCVVTYPGGLSTGSPVKINTTTLRADEQAFRSASVALRDSLAIYDSLIVNGTYTPLYPTLLIKSPWMAQSAMQGVADGRTLTYSEFINVLKENASLYRDPIFRNYVQHDYTITTADQDTLIQKSTVINRRTKLEASIQNSNMIMSQNATIIMMALNEASDTNVSVTDSTGAGICTDSTSIYYGLDSNSRYWGLDSVDAWLQNIGGLWTMYDRVGMYNARHEYSTANSLFHTINHIASMSSLIDAETYTTYNQVWNVLYGAEMAGRDIRQLTQAEIYALDTISRPVVTLNTGDQVLQNITATIGNVTIISPCILSTGGFLTGRDGDTTDTQSTTPPITDINDYTLNSRFSVYPNPASGIVTFEYSVPDPGENITILITNILGEKVQVLYTGNSAGRVYWDPRVQQANGVYLYEASDANGVISKGKILIITK